MSEELHWEKLSDKHQCPTCKNAAVNAYRPLGSPEDSWRYKVKCNCTSPGHLYFTSQGKMIKAWGDRVRVMKRSIEEQRKTEKEHAGRQNVIAKLQLGRKKGQGQAWRSPKFDRRKRKAVPKLSGYDCTYSPMLARAKEWAKEELFCPTRPGRAPRKYDKFPPLPSLPPAPSKGK